MKLSPHFDSAEFICHDGTDVPVELEPNLRRLVATADVIRRSADVPISVISGYRTPAYNARIGGAHDSTHMTAEALDGRPGLGLTILGLHAMILTLHRRGQLPGLGGLGLYPGWVHIDVRKPADGHLRRWSGSGVGSER